jgi:hypothetical protein
VPRGDSLSAAIKQPDHGFNASTLLFHPLKIVKRKSKKGDEYFQIPIGI